LKYLILTLLFLQFHFGQTQSFLLDRSEIEIIDSAFSGNKQRVFRILYLDENDCYNCQMKFKYLAHDSKNIKTYLLHENLQEDQKQQFRSEFGIDENIIIIRNPKLLKLLKDKSIVNFESRSFLIEINSTIITFIGNDDKKKMKQFFFQIDTTEKNYNIKTGKNYLSGLGISNIKKYKNDYIAISSPKSDLIYLKGDSINYTLTLDTALQVKAFNHLLENRPDSILNSNSYSKSLKTLLQYGNQLGIQTIHVENFTIIENYCFVYLDVSFPIWTSSSSIEMYVKPFLLKIKISDSNKWIQTDLFTVNYVNPVGKGVSPYAVNYFEYNKDLTSYEIGYVIIEDTVSDNEPRISHAMFSLSENQFSPREMSKSFQPDTIISHYNSDGFQNLALMHRRLNPNIYHYSFVPIIVHQNKVSHLNLYLKKRDSYRYHCTIKQENDVLLDFCSINGLYYFIYYKIQNNDYAVTYIEKTPMYGDVSCAEYTKNNLTIITKYNNKYFRKSIRFSE
jgi:hypothetical protein